jgi:ferredoxin
MKVWIDQDLCTGDGLCAEIAPDVFVMQNDGLAYVQEIVGNFRELQIFSLIHSNPQGEEGLARVPVGQEDLVREAAEECPGECIFIVE